MQFQLNAFVLKKCDPKPGLNKRAFMSDKEETTEAPKKDPKILEQVQDKKISGDVSIFEIKGIPELITSYV